MKKILFLLSIMLVTHAVLAQTDTSKIYNSKKLIKGFYRNYNDYISNSPFIITDFTLVPYHLKKKDTISIIAAEYRFGESKAQIPDYWGFCDGQSVYFHYPNTNLNTLSYKLEYLGPYPFFTYAEKKDLVGMSISAASFIPIGNSINPLNVAGLTLSILSFAEPTFYNLFIVTPSEKIKSAFNRNYMKKLFSIEKEILTDYQKEKDSLTNNKLKEFLIQYNNRMK